MKAVRIPIEASNAVTHWVALRKGGTMTSITFRHPDGSVETVPASPGESIMRAALRNGVDGIVGECGGQAMCATCHVYVVDDAGLPPVSEMEEEMLECTAAERRPSSRLGCQLAAGADFGDLEVELPATQL